MQRKTISHRNSPVQRDGWSAPEDLIQPIRAGHPIHGVQTARKFRSTNGFEVAESRTDFSVGKVEDDSEGCGDSVGLTI